MSTVVKATPEPGRGVLTATGSAGTGSVATGLASSGAVSTGAAGSMGGVSSTNELGVPRSLRASQPVTSLYCTVTYPSVTLPVCWTVLPIGTVKMRSKLGPGPVRIDALTVTLAGPTGSGADVGLTSGVGASAVSFGVSEATGTGVAVAIVSTVGSSTVVSAAVGAGSPFVGSPTGVGSAAGSAGKAAESTGGS